MFFKVQLNDFVLQIGKEQEKRRSARCQDCIHDGFICTHPKSSECQLTMFYGGEYKHFQAKQGNY